MLNEEHFGLIKQGVDAWNRWREEHQHTRPDLSGLAANLQLLIYRQLYAHGIRISNIDFEIEKELKKSA